jgi:hypothetical protein
MNPSFPRLTLVELRKMVDTRAGFWLQLIVGGLTLLVVVLFCIFGETDELIFRDMFALAIMPATILLPIVGILLVSSEWSQRTAMITFALVPKRMRVMRAKLAAGVVLGLVVLAIALVVAVVAIAAVGGDGAAAGFAPQAGRVVLGDHLCNRSGDLLAHRDVQELVGAVRVGMRSEHAGDHELRGGDLFAEHAHERDRAAFAHVHRGRAEEFLARGADRLVQPWR